MSVERLRDDISRIVRRYEDFVNLVRASHPPFPWDIWGADNDDLQIDAGRVLRKAIESGALIVKGIQDYPVYKEAETHGRRAPGFYADLFDRILWNLNLDPESEPDIYELHSKSWAENVGEDAPQRELLEARKFARLQRLRGEGLVAIAAMLGGAGRRTKPRTRKRKRSTAPSAAIKIDANRREARFRGKVLSINPQADFAVLAALVRAEGKIVSYADLLRAVKPDEVHQLVSASKEAPQEVKDAVAHIRRALTVAGSNRKIEAVRKHGYKLPSRHE